MEPMGGSPETQFLSHGHEITQVTQLHTPYPAGKRFLPIWQELSNRRCNKPSHCFLQSPKKLNSAWARTGRRELPQEPYEFFVMALEGEPSARRDIQTTVKEHESFNQWNDAARSQAG